MSMIPSVRSGSLVRQGRVQNNFVLGVLVLGALSALAWVYPEHRAIMLLAIQKLDPERRAVLDCL